MVEQVIIFGVFGIIATSVGFYIRRSRRNKVALQPLDLSRIPSLLGQKKRIRSSYREHLIRLNTTKIVKSGLSADGNESYLATSLIVEAASTVNNVLSNEFSSQEKITPKQLIHLLIPNKVQLRPKSEIFVAVDGCRVIYEQPGIEQDIDYLQSLLDMLIELIEVYPFVVSLGGEAIQPLILINRGQTQPLDVVASYLLRDIEIETTKRIGSDLSRFLCKRCLTRCKKHRVKVSTGNSVRYYGCRSCGQSRDLLDVPKQVVVILDGEMPSDRILHNGVLRVNWFTQQALFDFQAVEVRKTDDEELERFCVQVGNDTDETRKLNYGKVLCEVSSNAGISDNSLKILRSMFGEVRIKEFT